MRGTLHRARRNLRRILAGVIGQIGCELGCTFGHAVRTRDEEFLEQVCCVRIDWRFCANPLRADPRKTFEKLLDTWFHVRLGAGSLDVVNGRGGRAKTSPWTELEGGIARSRRDLTIDALEVGANPRNKLWGQSYTATRTEVSALPAAVERWKPMFLKRTETPL